jgi:ribosomal protein S18 acetylase RimI-like enzyme
MLEFKTMEDISLTELTQTFNSAFSDYLVKLQFSESQMLQKLKSENIQLSMSYGAYEKNKLVGFILNAFDSYYYPKSIYNAGTGVIPEFRGLRIIEQLYSYAIKELVTKGFVNHQLEVAIENEKAKKVYEKTGFKIYRDLACYKGKSIQTINSTFEVRKLNTINLKEVNQFWNYNPTWQNDSPTINRMIERLTVLAAEINSSIIGYCIFNKDSGRIHQLAVKKEWRNKGVGRSLINRIVSEGHDDELTILNIDKRDLETNQFLTNLGFTAYVDQYEMKLEINN